MNHLSIVKPTLPSDPPKIETMTDANITLSWMPSSNDDDMYIVEHQCIDGTWQQAGETKDTNMTVETSPERTNVYRVVAKNEFGTSEPTKALTVEQRAGPPLKVENLSVEAIGVDKATLSWQTPKTVQGHIDVPTQYEVCKR